MQLCCYCLVTPLRPAPALPSLFRPQPQPGEVRLLSELFVLQSTDDFEEGREYLPSFAARAASGGMFSFRVVCPAVC